MTSWRSARSLIVLVLTTAGGLVVGAIAGMVLPWLPFILFTNSKPSDAAGETAVFHGAMYVGMFTASIGALLGAGLGAMAGVAICRRMGR